jgi:hypothetical protein
VRAHFYPYAIEAKKQLKFDERFCKANGWTYHSDYVSSGNRIVTVTNPGLRRSGHATQEEVIAFLATILTKNPNAKIVPVHGKERFAVSDSIRDGLALHGLDPRALDILTRVKKGEHIIQLI